MKKQQKKLRKRHSEEFKLEAIELAKRIGVMKAANELEVHETSVRGWIKKLDGPAAAFNTTSQLSKKSYSELEKENKRLLKELGYMKEINRVLKKSTAIFSNDHMGNLK